MVKIENREEYISTLRSDILKETDQIAQKQRFALFSQPQPLYLGDDSYDKKEYPKIDPNSHKPITKPRNFQISAPKSGKINSSYFSVEGYTTIGDPYVDSIRKERKYELEKKKKIPADKPNYIPAKQIKENISSAYPYKPDKHKEDFEVKPRIDESTKKVLTGPTNIMTNPQSKDLFKTQKYESDQYDRQKELRRKQIQEHQEKLKDKTPFKTWDVGQKNFSTIRQQFGLDVTLPEPKKPLVERIDYHKYKHEAPFKPSNPPKTGLQKTLNPFPKYQEDPIKQVKRKPVEENKKDAFKLNHPNTLTRPTPTISCNYINLRKML